MTKKTTITQLGNINRDPLRADQGEWGLTDEGIEFTQNRTVKYVITDYGSPTRTVSQTSVFQNPLQLGLALTEVVRQTITVEPQPDADLNAEEFLQFVRENSIGKSFDYFVATNSTNLTYEESLSTGIDPTDDLLGVDFEYSYLDTEYERILADVTDHNLIPSMYELLDDTLVVDFEGTIVENKLTAPTSETLTDNIERALLMPRTELTNQIITGKNNDYVREYEANKFLFPMYCQINMPFRGGNKVSSALMNSDLSACLIRDYFGIYDSTVYGAPIASQGQGFDYSYTYYDATGTRRVDNAIVNSTTLDLEFWISNDLGGWVGGIPLPEDYSFFGPDSDEALLSQEANPIKFQNGVSILENSIDNFLGAGPPASVRNRRVLTFENMINGEVCYSEILMYKVVKYLGEGIDTPIQTFYFMNSQDLESELNRDKISFIDTQVKYNQTYTYSVTAIQAVLANRYAYTEANLRQNVVEIEVETKPYVKLVELPYFQVSGRILSDPPLSPELNFIPFRGKTDLILFHMNTNLGTEDLEPVSLNLQEAEDAQQIAINQRRNDGLITFQTDDYNRAYNIYRMAERPVSYQDFERNLLTSVSTVGDGLGSEKDAGSANIVIKQVTNKKYYYMFRSVDVHGLLSNPSEVYEIELYNDGGAGYPIIRKYDFTPIDPKTSTKSARKLIQIVPRISQAFLNTDASNLDPSNSAAGKTNIALGLEDEPLFAATSGYGVKEGKKFKIRLTSRSTGKKVDINVDFNTNRVRSEIE